MPPPTSPDTPDPRALQLPARYDRCLLDELTPDGRLVYSTDALDRGWGRRRRCDQAAALLVDLVRHQRVLSTASTTDSPSFLQRPGSPGKPFGFGLHDWNTMPLISLDSSKPSPPLSKPPPPGPRARLGLQQDSQRPAAASYSATARLSASSYPIATRRPGRWRSSAAQQP